MTAILTAGHPAHAAVGPGERFRKFAEHASRRLGSPWAFLLALTTVMAWAATGPRFHFSETWQIVINTGTTIITFLMVFLIQNTQNRDSRAMHLKLDELLRAVTEARTSLVNLEQLPDAELQELESEFAELHDEQMPDGGARAHHTPAQAAPSRQRAS